MTAYLSGKPFSVAVSAAQSRLRPGTRAWRVHVLCTADDCPKCCGTALTDLLRRRVPQAKRMVAAVKRNLARRK